MLLAVFIYGADRFPTSLADFYIFASSDEMLNSQFDPHQLLKNSGAGSVPGDS